jgi:DNA gyrase subunit A
MGRNTSGVKGISLRKDDVVVGMVVVDPEATLLTVCENGYGKRTKFGPKSVATEENEEEDISSAMRYRTQRRGGKGVRDIKTTDRNGRVVGVVPVQDTDEILLMTARGKLQRINCGDVKPIGRNTQGVSIMRMDEGDALAAVVRVPRDENVVDVSPDVLPPRPTTDLSATAPAFDEFDENGEPPSDEDLDES